MCHNLGGLDIISPSQLITYKHQGDWYRFGTKAPSLVNDGTNNVLNWIESGNSAFPPYYSSDAGYPNAGNWPDDLNADIGNPCPAGWKLPTNDEWKAVITNNTATNVPASWVSASALTFSNLKKLGNELMLPAAGGRTSAATAEGQGNSGRYYSSTNYKSNYAWYMRFNNDANLYTSNVAYRSSPLSVRCIAAE
jgi:uncharacterized protein (TIGR02145 family)